MSAKGGGWLETLVRKEYVSFFCGGNAWNFMKKVRERYTILFIMSVKVRGSGGVKALTDMSAITAIFLDGSP